MFLILLAANVYYFLLFVYYFRIEFLKAIHPFSKKLFRILTFGKVDYEIFRKQNLSEGYLREKIYRIEDEELEQQIKDDLKMNLE